MTDDKRWPRWVYSEGKEPDYRISFANECAYLAWIRTALALLAAGVALDVVDISITAWAQKALTIVTVVLGLSSAAAAWTVGPSVTDQRTGVGRAAATSFARSFTDRWERTVLIPGPPISTWIRSASAQIRATLPALWAPIQNCRWVTIMFPLGGTTRSNSTGPPVHAADTATTSLLAWSSSSAAATAVTFGVATRVGGSHSSSNERSSTAAGANR